MARLLTVGHLQAHCHAMVQMSSKVYGVDRQGYVPIASMPVHAYEDRFPVKYVYPKHAHNRSQLSFSLNGVMSVLTDKASFILPPNRAMWIPANVEHQVSSRSGLHFHIVYIDPDFGPQPEECCVLNISPLTRGLIHEITTFDSEYDMDGREGRIVRLLLDEIARMPSLPLNVMLPIDPRLRRVCDALYANPSDNRDIEEWSKFAAMSRRSFTRLFKEETGMGFAVWRRQIRLMDAVARLSSGESVTSVALSVGYDSPSAFTSMFRRAFGMPPRDFRGENLYEADA